MSIVSLFVPETLKIYHSEFNGEIKLIRFADDLRLDVGGLTQSGNVMVGIFATGINNLLPPDCVPAKILMLGLGGGSVVKWLAKKYKRAKITAVEIDPVMIEIARRHFHVDVIKNLKIINQDAVGFIKKTKERYDIILVDCYQGHATPEGFDDPKTLRQMKSHCDYLLVNRLYWDDFKTQTDDFVAKMSQSFQIKSVFTASNLVISLS